MFAEDEPRVELVGALKEARRRSLEVGRELEGRLRDALPETVATVVAVGSLGRMELVPTSDLDLVVVLRDDTPGDAGIEREAYESVWSVAESLGYLRPKSEGIFGTPTRGVTLCDPSRRGRVEEESEVFGKRLHLLLEGRPVFGGDAFAQLLANVLGWYGFGESHPEPYREWSTLVHDLERYRHSLAVRYQWLHRDDPTTWRRLQLKWRFSRTLNVAGLATLVGECSRQSDARGWLFETLRRPPLERIALLGNDVVERVVPLYERFLASMAGPELPIDTYESLLRDAGTFRAAIGDGLEQRSSEWSSDLRTARWV